MGCAPIISFSNKTDNRTSPRVANEKVTDNLSFNLSLQDQSTFSNTNYMDLLNQSMRQSKSPNKTSAVDLPCIEEESITSSDKEFNKLSNCSTFKQKDSSHIKPVFTFNERRDLPFTHTRSVSIQLEQQNDNKHIYDGYSPRSQTCLEVNEDESSRNMGFHVLSPLGSTDNTSLSHTITHRTGDASIKNLFEFMTTPKVGQEGKYPKIKFDIFNKNNSFIVAKELLTQKIKLIFSTIYNLSSAKEQEGNTKLNKSYFHPQLYKLLPSSNDIKIKNYTESSFSSYAKKNSMRIIDNKYEILELVAKEPHNIWTIHKCRWIQMDKSYLVKIYDKNLQNKQQLKPFLISEYFTWKRMLPKHKLNTIEIISSDLYDYIIMESTDMLPLSAYLLDNKLDVEQVREIFRNILSLIDYCYNIARIAVRNINLDTLFIRPGDMTVKLMDLSHATVFHNENEIGNTRYLGALAPPDYKLNQAYNGTSIDLWACGMILHYTIYNNFPKVTSNEPINFTNKVANVDIGQNGKRLLSLMLSFNSEDRISFSGLKKNNFVTCNGKIPFPNVFEVLLDFLDKDDKEEMSSMLENR